LPNISRIEGDLSHLNQKLVRFDCIIADMFEEEFYVSVVSHNDKQFVYKYFSEVHGDQAEMLNHCQPDGTNTLERSNLLGATLVCQSPWVGQQQRL
jgi:hypothetical protein